MSKQSGQIVTVDARLLGLGISHAFQGMAEVCAAIGVPQDELLKAVDKAESRPQPLSPGRKNEPVPKDDGATAHQEVKKNADQTAKPDMAVGDVVDTAGAGGGNAADAAEAVNKSAATENQSGAAVKPPSDAGKQGHGATADDIARILTAKVRQKRIKSEDARTLLEKYGAKSVSALDPQYYDAVLEEASGM